MRRDICVVFDIDDTVYLERDYVRSGFAAAGRWASRWLGIDDFAERCWNRFTSGARGSIFNLVLTETYGKANPELVSALIEIYRTHTPAIALADDARESLAKLSSLASIAVISDGPLTSQSQKADVLDLYRFAAPVILTDMLGSGFRKPHPLAFQRVEQSQLAKIYCYVADNPLKDFTAPKQLGWTTVRIRRPCGLHYTTENPEIRPDYEMADCSGLFELLGRF
jgi:putative hydrolase of the HAD superfamily